MGSYLGFRPVSAERRGLTQAHWDGRWRVLNQKSCEARRCGRPGEDFTAGVHSVGPHAWVGSSGLFTENFHVTARTMNEAIDRLELVERRVAEVLANPVLNALDETLKWLPSACKTGSLWVVQLAAERVAEAANEALRQGFDPALLIAALRTWSAIAPWAPPINIAMSGDMAVNQRG